MRDSLALVAVAAMSASAVIAADSPAVRSVPTYTNPTIAADSPDPGVAWDPLLNLWVVTTTSGNPTPSGEAFAIHTSPTLTNWTSAGYVFNSTSLPVWANGGSFGPSFWAPEPHFVNGQWLVYFVARTAEEQLCVGVAASTTPYATGP
jgi:arabinan endo-1,5-alpha-L-arabinosidase